MIERGIVNKIGDGQFVSVTLCPDEACESCAACAAFGRNKPQVVKTMNTRSLPLKPGDFVEIYLATGRTIKAAFMVLILPLVCFFALYAGIGRLGVASEALRVLAGSLGLAAVFGLNYLSRGNRNDLPEVVRITPSPFARTGLDTHSR